MYFYPVSYVYRYKKSLYFSSKRGVLICRKAAGKLKKSMSRTKEESPQIAMAISTRVRAIRLRILNLEGLFVVILFNYSRATLRALTLLTVRRGGSFDALGIGHVQHVVAFNSRTLTAFWTVNRTKRVGEGGF